MAEFTESYQRFLVSVDEARKQVLHTLWEHCGSVAKNERLLENALQIFHPFVYKIHKSLVFHRIFFKLLLKVHLGRK